MNETWKVANGGKEPVTTIDGKHYQYHYCVETKQRAYYCFEDDLFLTDGLEYMLPPCLRG